MKKIVVGLVVVAALVAVALIAPQATRWVGRSLQSDEELLLSRVEGYWQSRVDGEVDQMVQYHHPDQEGVGEPSMVVTQSYVIQGVSIEGDEAIATVDVVNRFNHPGLSGRIRENTVATKWVRLDDGEWYRALRPTNLGQMLEQVQKRLHPEAAGDELPVSTVEDEPERR